MAGVDLDGQVDDDAVLERAGQRDAAAEALDRPADHLAGGGRLELVGAGLYLLRFDVDFGAGGHDVVPFVFRAVVRPCAGPRPGSTRLGAGRTDHDVFRCSRTTIGD